MGNLLFSTFNLRGLLIFRRFIFIAICSGMLVEGSRAPSTSCLLDPPYHHSIIPQSFFLRDAHWWSNSASHPTRLAGHGSNTTPKLTYNVSLLPLQLVYLFGIRQTAWHSLWRHQTRLSSLFSNTT
ncbi:hypothetical protein DFH27DRAFT_295799 [Peziza echinospora]|nr:hypothetical protein DFH27DRAFT_295799 [Peziza echinospora]